MTLTRTTPGLIQKDNFDTNTLANYTTTAATWNSIDKCVTLTNGSIADNTLAISDSVFTARVKVDNWSGNPTIYSRYRVGYTDNISVRLGASVVAMFSGITYIGNDASKGYSINTYYQVKLSMSGTRIKYKMWQDGTAEPSTWLFDATDTHPVIQGGWRANCGFPSTVQLDNVGIYKSTNVVCTGLPTGYKLRVGTITATESGGTSTVDCSAVSFPLTSVDVLNASGVVVDTLTPSGGVWGGDVYSYQGGINVNLTTDTKRKSRYTSWVGLNSRRKATVRAIDGFDSIRRVSLLVSTLLATKRHTRAVFSILTDSTRKFRKSLILAADSLRRGCNNTVSLTDGVRRLKVTRGLTVDTYRKNRISELYYIITLRRIVAQVTALANTARQLTTNQMAIMRLDTQRKIRAAVTLQSDTRRKILKIAVVVGDTVRLVIKQSVARVDVDLKRIVRATAQARPDTQRKLRKLMQAVGDTLRLDRVLGGTVTDSRRKVRVVAQSRGDSSRRLSKLIQAVTDTKRRAATIVELTTDTARRTLRRYVELFVVDTIRQILSILVREAPVYDWSEVGLRYDCGELDSRYSEAEKDYSYSWEGDEDVKSFTLGEEKVVGVEVTTQDGTPFSIASATYSYKSMSGSVLTAGSANVEGSNVFILLAPQATGFGQKVVFTIQLQPLTAGGDPDLSKSREIIKPVVKVEVAEE